MTSADDIGRRMSEVYVRGPVAGIVSAGAAEGLMNLGIAPAGADTPPLAERQRHLVDLVFSTLGPEPGQAILDLGCGKGGAMVVLSQALPSARIHGVNIDREQLAIGRERLGSGFDLVASSAEALPYEAGTFDRIYAIELMSHIRDKRAVAAEVRRVLRPGGRVVLTYMTLNRPYAGFDQDSRAYLQLVAAFFRESPEDFLTQQDYLGIWAAEGLALETVRDLTDEVFPHRYAEHRRTLEVLRSHSLRSRIKRLRFRAQWDADPAALAEFLEVNTRRHPCRYYEYHLASWRHK